MFYIWEWKDPPGQRLFLKGVSGVLCLFYMMKHFEILRIRKEEWRIEGRYIVTLCNMGVPMGLQYSITAVGSVILQTAVNSFGIYGRCSCHSRFQGGYVFCCMFDALGGTMATYAGQNVGARKMERINQGMKASVVIGAVYSVLACIVLICFGRTIALLFMKADEVQILGRVQHFLIINSLFYIPLPW